MAAAAPLDAWLGESPRRRECERPRRCRRSPHVSRALGTGGRELPCDGRKPLPPLVGRQRVEGGAPYMYEPSLGVPQYPPDERWDSQLTYPLSGNYVLWARASTPDRQQPVDSGPAEAMGHADFLGFGRWAT